MQGVESSGYIKEDSYVTLDSIENMSAQQRVNALCLNDINKGKCLCKCHEKRIFLQIPLEGPNTCSNFSQRKVVRNLQIHKRPYYSCDK